LLGDSKEYNFVKLAKELTKELVFVDFSIFNITNTPSDIYSSGYCYSFDSCMQNLEESFFDIYDDLENCRLLYILGDSHVLLGRALLWDNIYLIDKDYGKIIKKVKLMDRIYAEDYTTKIKFVHYAKKHGYCYRLEGKYYFPDGNIIDLKKYSFLLKLPDFIEKGYYNTTPYFDTFNYLLEKESKLYLASSTIYGFNYLDELINTNGESYLSNPIRCYYCDCRVTVENSIYIEDLCEYVCQDCFYSYYTHCSNCNDIVPINDALIAEDGEIFCSEYCANEFDYYRCSDCGDLRNIKDLIKVGDILVCHNCIKNYTCDFCANYNEELDNFILLDNNSINTKNICPDCLNNIKNKYYIDIFGVYCYDKDKDKITAYYKEKICGHFLNEFLRGFDSYSYRSIDIYITAEIIIEKLLQDEDLDYLRETFKVKINDIEELVVSFNTILADIIRFINTGDLFLINGILYSISFIQLKYPEIFYYVFYKLRFGEFPNW